MDQPTRHYWSLRLDAVKTALEANNFQAFVADTAQDAAALLTDRILPATEARTVSWGGSMTFVATGLVETLKQAPSLQALDTFERDTPPEELMERRRQALLADLFLTGANAVTESGQLVNLDMTGNRVAAIAFGPRHVVVFAGRNKISADVDGAMRRVKNYAAPVNAMRLDKKTPCVKTSRCEECDSPQRICNTWTITEKSFPKHRIKVVLINEDLGL